MNITILERPFEPALVKTRKGAFGRELNYVEGRHYINRLNEAFEGEWSFEIVEHLILAEEVIVLGKITANGVSKVAFGGTQITRSRTHGTEVSIADDLKAAATDALKKGASLLGIGLSLYDDDVSHGGSQNQNGGNGRSQTPRTHHDLHDVTGRGAPGNGNGRGNGTSQLDYEQSPTTDGQRLTSKQLGYIWRIARDLDMPQRDVRSRALEIFGRQPEYLSKGEASTLISSLRP